MAAKPKPQQKPKPGYALRDFYLDDLQRTLFPLATNKVLVELGLDRLVEFG
jgi:hypothetical protein